MSLTSTPCKTLEQIIYHRLITHFEQNNIFFDSQHGFRKRRGCDTQLLILIDELASALDQRKQIDLVIMDSFKVFVNVPHQRLLLKLQQHGLESSGPARGGGGVVGYQYTRYFAPKISIYLKIVKCLILNT